MSRDYKAPIKGGGGGSRGGSSSLLFGILIGLVLGLGIALAVAWYINKMPTPFVNHANPPAKGDAAKGAEPRTDEKGGAAQGGKPRFDFYKILPGSEEAVTEQQLREAQQRPAPATPSNEAFYLQAGAFQNALDADNLKARLALLGLEAVIQTTSLQDKGLWYRVRIGPYTAIEDLNRARDNLKQNGIETSLIRVRDTPAQPAKIN